MYTGLLGQAFVSRVRLNTIAEIHVLLFDEVSKSCAISFEEHGKLAELRCS
jgi:hypothetical protein